MHLLTNRFHVPVRLYSNRSQLTSKSCKNKKVAREAIGEFMSLIFLLHFDVLCDLLLSRRMKRWNVSVLYKKKQTPTAFLSQNLSQLLESQPLPTLH